MLGSKCKILALGMYIKFSCCLCQFHLHWVANTNAIFSEKWALVLRILRLEHTATYIPLSRVGVLQILGLASGVNHRFCVAVEYRLKLSDGIH